MPQAPQKQAASTDWRYNGSDAASTKFAPVTQIDSSNFDQLRLVWRWRAPDREILESEENSELWVSHNQNTPLSVDGVLYTSTSLSIAAAVDAATGREIWTFDPEAWRKNFYWNVHRGVAYWNDGEVKRILYGTSSAMLYSLDARTGKPDLAFGDSGRVDLAATISLPDSVRWMYGVTSPPIVCNNVVVIGAATADAIGGPPPDYTPPGDVHGFDVRTGELLWTFHTIPHEGEFGRDTWKTDQLDRFGAANVWSKMSADEALGYIYMPVSSPSHDYYGGEREGDNLFGESLVCLDAATGERIWHFQITHHGLWDYDPPTAPLLIDIEVDGKPIKAVVQLSKMGFCFVFDRATGEPVWPIVETAVPQSTIPGEHSSPTQPFPTKPAPYDQQGMLEHDVIDLTPELKREALEILEQYDPSPLYAPPSASEKGAIAVHVSDWTGAAALPERGWIYVPSNKSVVGLRVSAVTDTNVWSAYRGYHGREIPGPRGLPIARPPYSSLTAIDLSSGDHVWTKPVGAGPVNHPALSELDLPDLGWESRTFVTTTPTLLMLAAWAAPGKEEYDFYVDPENYLRAYDLDDGHQIGQADLPTGVTGNPITYVVDGRQYIVIPIGSEGRSAELLGLAIPREGEELPPQGYDRNDADHPLFYQAVQAIDAGDRALLQELLEGNSQLSKARGYQDELYEYGHLRGASLLHLVPGNPIRAQLQPNVLELTSALLAAGADPNAVTLDSVSVLELAMDSDQLQWLDLRLDLVKMLLEGGIAVDEPRGKLMLEAVVRNDSVICDLLISEGAAMDLRFAAGLNRVDLMVGFFDGGALAIERLRGFYRPSDEGESDWTSQTYIDEAFSYAAAAGSMEAARFLLQQGVQINALTSWRWNNHSTALHKAANRGRLEMVHFLLEQGASPLIRDERWEEVPSAWAWRHQEIMQLLIKRENEAKSALSDQATDE